MRVGAGERGTVGQEEVVTWARSVGALVRTEARRGGAAGASALVPARLLIGGAFVLAVLMIVLAGNMLDRQTHRLIDSAGWVIHTRDVELGISRLLASLSAAEGGVRGYALTGQPDYLDQYEKAEVEVPRELSGLRSLTADNPAQQDRLRALGPLIEEKFEFLGQAVTARDAPRGMDDFVGGGRGKDLMDRIRKLLAEMTIEEERLLALRQQQTERQNAETLWQARAIAVLGILLITIAFAWVAVAMQERIRAERDARKLAESLDLERRQLIKAIAARDAAEAAKELRERRLRQEQAMATIGRLAGGLSHVLNNALSVIIGHAELMAARKDRPDADRDSLQAMLDSAQVAARLTDQFRSFGQQQFLAPEEVELNGLLGDLKQIAGPTLLSGIAIDLQRNPSPVAVAIDRQKLLAALTEVIENAAEAMPNGGELRLELTQRRLTAAEAEAMDAALSPGSYAQIVIADTGSGMSEETRQHAFEPFYSTKDASEGAGLGLSMAYGIVRQSGGHMWLRSRLGHGTEVGILLPATTGRTKGRLT